MKVVRLLFCAAAVSLALFTTTSAFAEVRQGAVTVSPFAGGYLFEGDQKLRTNNFMAGMGVGYLITDHIGVEGVLGYINGGRRNEDASGGPVPIPGSRSLDGAFLTSGVDGRPYRGGVDGYLYKVEGLYHFNPKGKLVPFVAAGIGGLTLDPVQGPGGTTAIFDYGAGLQYFLSENLAFRTDVRHVIEINEGENNLMYTAGLTYYIGGVRPAPVAVTPPPPPPPAPVPAPPAPKVEAPAPKQEAVCIDLKVLFDFDKDEVKSEYIDDIKRVADFLKANPTFHGTIEGGTDAVGSEDYNLGLSVRRAESVKKVLVDKYEIDPGRLKTVGYGKVKPIATNLTEEGRQVNRRAVRVYCSDGEDIPPPPVAQKCIVLKVDFAVGSSKVDADKYAGALKEVADYMNAHPDFVGTVEGYADATGNAKLNMDLSMKRSENVKKVLVEKYGVPANRLRAEGYGKERPINTNETVEGRAQNRYAVQVICEPE